MKRFLERLFINKKRKVLLKEFVEIIREVSKIQTIEDCFNGYHKIGDFTKKLSQNKKDLPIKSVCGKLIEYITDTKEHINKGYHKPSHNRWNVVRVYPDINDYVDLGVKLKRF